MTAALERYISTVLKMPAKAEFITRLNNLSGLSGTPMSPLLTNWVRQNFGLSSVAAIQNWSSGKFSPEMLLRWTSVFPSSFENGAIRADLYEILTGGGVIPPVANFSGSPTSINIGDTVAFTDLSTNTPTSWSWAFAGGTPATSTTQNPSVVYNTAGTYNVDLTATNAGGSDLESKPNYITVVNPYLLDNYSGAAAAYSVRKLSSSYTGAALRVRRSSDNTEQDIGFTGLNLDTTSLSAFVGAGNGFVTKWYDQSGNGYDFIQNTAAQQFKIVNSGTIYTSNGIPAIRIDNTTTNSMTNTLSTLQNLPVSIYTCFELISLPTNIYNNFCAILTGSGPTDDFGRYEIGISNNNYFGQRRIIGSPFTNTNTNDVTTNKRNIFAHLFRATQIDGYQNTNSYLGTAYSGSPYNNASNFKLGKSNGSVIQNPLGHYQELIIYLSDQNANNTGIRTNMNSYYSVY